MIPRLVDDGSIKAGIAALRPYVEVNEETPHGRLAAIDEDTWRVYSEMYELLAGNVTSISPEAYEERLHDLAVTLTDLHKRAERAFTEIMEARP